MTPMEQPTRPRTVGNVTRLETPLRARVQMMIHYVARQEARQAVIRRLKAEGRVRVSLMSASQITQLAKAHLQAHAAELLAAAERSGAVQRLIRDEAAHTEEERAKIG
jgi:hypothetical protein